MPTLAESAWGTGYWGLGAWGAVLPIAIEECYPLGPRTIYIRFNTPPQAASPVSEGDVQNRKTWDLTRDDTGEAIQVIGAQRGVTDLEWRLYLLTRLGPAYVTHTLRGQRLRSAGGLPMSPPTFISFVGVDVNKPVLRPAVNRDLVVDLRNDNFFGQGQAIRPDSSGNYEVQSGASGLRKRILRILVTKPGEWPGDPDFGVGIEVKSLARDPQSWKKRIEDQVARDPEVQSVRATVEVTDLGVVYITVRARMTTGSEGDFRYKADSGGVVVA